MTFEETVRAMTGPQIVHAMTNGLRKRWTYIDMSTFGYSDFRNICYGCYGCAATNAVCQIVGKSFDKYSINGRSNRARFLNVDQEFLELFECAIDSLRVGNVENYNWNAEVGKFATLPVINNLPFLTADYTEELLQEYEKAYPL